MAGTSPRVNDRQTDWQTDKQTGTHTHISLCSPLCPEMMHFVCKCLPLFSVSVSVHLVIVVVVVVTAVVSCPFIRFVSVAVLIAPIAKLVVRQ